MTSRRSDAAPRQATGVVDLGRITTYRVCDVPIAAVEPAEAVRLIVEVAAAGQRLEAHLCNAYTLSLVDQDLLLRDALVRADLNLADGTPVAWLGRRHGVRGPVRGPGLVLEVCREGASRGLRHFFYGGAPEVADEMATSLLRQIPDLQIAGTDSPSFGDPSDADLDEVAQRIAASGASVVWVGLGTPRQDHVVPRLASRVDAAVIPVGAAFDFLAGRVAEAPTWLHGSGLEWVHRLMKEPARLWRRYLFGNLRFLRHALFRPEPRADRG